MRSMISVTPLFPAVTSSFVIGFVVVVEVVVIVEVVVVVGVIVVVTVVVVVVVAIVVAGDVLSSVDSKLTAIKFFFNTEY